MPGHARSPAIKRAAVEALRRGGGGGMVQQNTFVVQGNIDQRTQSQIANKLRRETVTAQRRFG